MHKLQKRYEKKEGEKSVTVRGDFSHGYVYWLEKNLLDARFPGLKDGLLWKCNKCEKAYQFKDNAKGCCRMEGIKISKSGVCLLCGNDAELNEIKTGNSYCYNCLI